MLAETYPVWAVNIAIHSMCINLHFAVFTRVCKLQGMLIDVNEYVILWVQNYGIGFYTSIHSANNKGLRILNI